ncbi:MAG: TIGR00282 family metallophosphoesterase [Firmicutes bacterium]|nr:TIGR00282 family metallophosphoesterase [Bacillota bacterium]
MIILFIGDIVGRPGRMMVEEHLVSLRRETGADLVIANGENAAGGIGLTRDTADEIFGAGVDVITMGNHVWDKKELLEYINVEPRILRPLNYPGKAPGQGSIIVDGGGSPVAVVNAAGRVFNTILLECPFRKLADEVDRLKAEARVVVVDFHAEATSEKVAMGWYLDRKVTAVVGTHTHVQTADEMVLPGGTAYITDVGMTGPYHSIIGIQTDLVLDRFLTQIPVKFEVAKGPRQLSAVVIEADETTGKTRSIRRILIRE